MACTLLGLCLLFFFSTFISFTLSGFTMKGFCRNKFSVALTFLGNNCLLYVSSVPTVKLVYSFYSFCLDRNHVLLPTSQDNCDADLLSVNVCKFCQTFFSHYMLFVQYLQKVHLSGQRVPCTPGKH